MSQRYSKDAVRRPKTRTKVHKVTKAIPLNKYRIKRPVRIMSDWPSTKINNPSTPFDLSEASKTVRAYLEVNSRYYKRLNRIPSKANNIALDFMYENPEIDSESYCNCNQPYLLGELMFKCEGFCGNWYHPQCLKMKVEEIERQKNSSVRWYCPKCINRAKEVMMECYETPLKYRTTTIG